MSIRRTLHLVSPHMRDGQDKDHPKDVSDAEYLLNNNVFKERYYYGNLDGEYGILAGQAAYRAKYWLGYPKYAIDPNKRVNQQFGASLFAYLHGDEPLPAINKWRRNIRLKSKNDTPLREKALAIGRKYVGVKESPAGSNRVLFSLWYNLIGAWCAMFLTFDYVGAGSKAFKRGQNYAYVPYMEGDARAGRNNLTIVLDPQPGDIVCFDWDHDGISDHTGFFVEWVVKGQTFNTLEGNTAIGNDSNGGEVMNRERSISDISFAHTNTPAFIHVGT